MAPEKWGGVPGSEGCGLKGTGLNHPGTLGRGSELGGRAESRLASFLSAGPPITGMQGAHEGRLMHGGWRGGAPVSGPASGPGNSGQSLGDTGGRPAPGALIGTGCFTLAVSRCGCW